MPVRQLPTRLRQILGDKVPTDRSELEARLAAAGPAGQAIAEALAVLPETELNGILQELHADRFVAAAAAIGRAQEAQSHLAHIDGAAFAALASSFSDTSVTSSKRGELIEQATGAPLSEAAREVVHALATATPPGVLAAAAGGTQQALRPGGALRDDLATAWFAPFVPEDLVGVGRELEVLRTAAETPAFHEKLEQVLDIVRVATRIEAHNLEKVVVTLPPEAKAAATEAVSTYFVRVAGIGLAAMAGLSAPPEDLDTVARSLLSLQALQGDASPATALKVQAALRDLTSVVQRTSAQPAAKDAAPLMGPVLKARLDDEAATLLATLRSKGVQTTPESALAITELFEDAASTVVVMAGLARMSGAIANPNMAADDRASSIKTSAESLGPIFVKLLQTVGNQEAILAPVLQHFAGGDDGPAVVRLALKKLQDKVTPMPFADVRTQLEASLGKRLEDVFVAFEPEAFASASIGQCHKAKLKVGDELVDVVVKVQRVGLAKDFERTSRVARLTLAVLKEAVPTLPTMGKQEKETLTRLLGTIDSTLDGFLGSFVIEMDFRHEAHALGDFNHDMRVSSFVTAPKAYMEQSSKEVLTMEYMRGEKLEDLLARFSRAEAAPAPQRAPVSTAAVAEQRAREWAVRALGVDVKSATVRPGADGFDVKLKLDHHLVTSADLHVGNDGALAPAPGTPVLDADSMHALRDRLLGTFLSQALVHGMLHGDLHQGNFMVLGDAKTIALLDFGNVIRIQGSHIRTAGMLVWSWWQRDAGGMARSLLRMSSSSEGMSKQERAAAEKMLTAAFAQAHADKPGPIDQDRFLELLSTTALQANITLSPVFLQSIKTSVSMSGNLVAFADAKVGFDRLGTTNRRIAATLANDAIGKMNPLAARIQHAKDVRVRKLNVGSE